MDEIKIIRSSRRTMSMEITCTGEILVRAPYKIPDTVIRSFVEQKASWIEKHMKTVRDNLKTRKELTEKEIRMLADRAMTVIPDRVRFYAEQMGITYGRITLRRQKTRWGSCSSRGNLNFNVLLMLAPPEILDYVVVHELCHRLEMNHSERFWNEVAKVMPDYKARQKWLKKNGGAMAGLP